MKPILERPSSAFAFAIPLSICLPVVGPRRWEMFLLCCRNQGIYLSWVCLAIQMSRLCDTAKGFSLLVTHDLRAAPQEAASAALWLPDLGPCLFPSLGPFHPLLFVFLFDCLCL